MISSHNEAFSRVLIDKALEFSEWDLLDTKQVQFESHTKNGRADYLLKDNLGRVICVLEAKREDVDPYDAKEQARGYAENLKSPFIILSNGRDHWFWNYERTDQRDAYRIERLPSREDLERVRLKNLQPPRGLQTENITPGYLRQLRHDLTLRRYQIEAMDEIAKLFDLNGQRKFLLEMATGTGKTLLCAALIRRFLTTQNAERALFIVDRIELAKQTMEDFAAILPEFKPVIFKSARRTGELLGASVVVATIQSLMTNRRYREEFTPFYFDLVINDEAHRSIYGDAREVVQFFQATRIGLTATPKAYLKNVNAEQLQAENPKALEARKLRDTYHYFGCKPGFPTYRYDIIDAVKDPEGPFLCLPKIFDLRSDITTKALAESGWAVYVDEREESFKIQDLERRIFTPDRNRLMCEFFLKEAQKDPSGAIGKSIIFAVNQTHATNLTKIFNALQPGIALTITSRIKDASFLAKEFRDGKRLERIAVSVDMLSTGYNCRDLLNIGLMRPIFSPTEYIQIKGRGTRRYTFQIGQTEYEKQHFFMLDFCAVAEYFEEKYDYSLPLKLPVAKPSQKEPYPTGGDKPGVVAEPPGGGPFETTPGLPHDIPIWEGKDTLVSHEVHIVGPNGEKVDVMTFRGSFEQEIKEFVEITPELKSAVEEEDDDIVEEIVNEQFYHRPEMFYSSEKLIISYGVPATTPDFVYNAVGKRPLPTNDEIVADTVDSIAARFNLRYNEQKWVEATTQLLAADPRALRQFIEGDITIFTASQFNQLGGISALAQFENREQVFEALRQSTLIRQSLLAIAA
ncbi:MAG: DEAD/DEAH box helicase family protein [Ignavibacteriales bacterium]|nr:DEAD/DEAH box helicase family protein [Ignavibacteriales bacterium]MBI3787745.1 DEAD/DEAH box helicase family protein [Ignavibacteriales bacterium]